jgi:GAF domain-containing protein
LETNLARTFAALSATNEAILYAKSPKELYEQVSKAAFSSGDFLATAVFLLEPGTNLLRFVAGFGEDIARLRSINISIVAGTPEGSGVCGQAFRDQKLCVSNDFMNDTRSLAWRQGVQKGRVGAAVALPLICNGESVGVLLVTRREAGSISEQMVSLLERVSANICFALDNFDHEAARKNGERAMRRLNRMFGAISATNEAILRAKTEQDLYQRICDAAVHSGKSVATVVLLAEPGSIWLKPVAGTGELVELITRTRFSIDPDNVYGTGVCGNAFRTQKPCINNDVQNSAQGQPWRQVGREMGVVACVALPLTKAGQSVGVLMVFVSKSWAADEDIIALLTRMAENASFALDNFERNAEKAKTEEQKERLTRMFAALSATNEAIVRPNPAPSCSNWSATPWRKAASSSRPASRLPSPAAITLTWWRWPVRERRIPRKITLSINPAHPEGRGLSGTAFRSRQACISNDYLTDPRGIAFHPVIRSDGAKSGAAFPLFARGETIGIILFLSAEKDTFAPEFSELLQRLADNVSFALENFDRADEKAKAERQKDRLAGMLKALSATNEAIMRVKTRAELFELVCEAAVLGGVFTSATIALAEPDGEVFRIAATNGLYYHRMKDRRFATSAEDPDGQGLTACRLGRASLASSMTISAIRASRTGTTSRGKTAPDPAQVFRCCRAAARLSASCCFFPPTRASLRRIWWNCWHDWQRMFPSRSITSIAPRKRPEPRSRSSGWR